MVESGGKCVTHIDEIWIYSCNIAWKITRSTVFIYVRLLFTDEQGV